MNNSAKIVITGASGFLGKHLVTRLKDDMRFQVYALSSHPDELSRIASGSNITFLYKDDILENNAKIILNDAIVVNCAYPRNSTGSAIADGLRYIKNLFLSAVNNNAAAIINISSQSVYSQQRTEAAVEETPVCLETPYAVGKYAVELMLESICCGTTTSFTNLRMASLIGPGFDQRIVNRLIRNAIATRRIVIKDTQQKFGFFDVQDAVSALAVILISDKQQWKPVYNLGAEKAYTLKEIARTIIETIENQYPTDVIIEPDDQYANSELNANLFYHDFHFFPDYTLKNSIQHIFSSIEKERGKETNL